MFNSGYKGIRAVDGSGIVTLKDVEVQQTSLQPKITSWAYTNGAYVPYPDTAIVGGETIVIYGSGFQNGANVYIGSTSVTSTRLDQNRITFTAPSQSAGSYVLYVVNPNGNAAVYAPGIYYNSYPVWNTTTYANTFITPTSSVSFNLNATDSANLTFTLQSGSLPTGLTLYPSGLISGTTTVANTTVYTFTAVATDSFNQAAQASIIYTITYTVSDPYFNQTTLLLNGETNTNTYIQDSSTNNFALTPVGAATSNRFSPLWGNGYYGNSFDGSSGYLSISNNTALNLSSGDFTIECWFYSTVGSREILNKDGVSGTSYSQYEIYINSSNLLVVNLGNGNGVTPTDTDYGASTSVSLNTWHHVVCQRTGTTISVYFDGVRVTNTAQVTAMTDGGKALLLGHQSGASSDYFSGYISNIRIVKGTAVYSGASISIPTSPLTAIANTVLLTCQSPNFVDNGPNGYVVTPNGTVKVVPNQPFGIVPTTATSNTNNAGYYSNWFDGSTAYLSMPYNSAFDFGTGNFTIEAWVYLTQTPGTGATILGSTTTGGTNFEWRTSSTIALGTDGVAWRFTSNSFTAPLNSWFHIAVSRASGVAYMWLNGQSIGSGAETTSFTAASGPVLVGRSVDGYLNGSLSNLRVLNGVALYTSAFTPPTSPLTAIANTALLTCQSSNFVDNSTNAFTLTTSGKVNISQNQPFASPTVTTSNTTPSVYGSGYFDGSTGYITLPNTSQFNLSSINWTIEMWVYPTTSPSAYQTLISKRQGSTADWELGIQITSGYLYFYTSTVNATSTVVPLNTWSHIAASYDGTNVRLFQNGILTSTISTSAGTSTNPVFIGCTSGAVATYNQFFPGYISNLRVIKGTSLYTNNFLPTNQPLAPVANTVLLTLQNKNSANNNVFYDDSVNNFAITRTGTPTQGTFTPFSQTGWSNYFAGSGYMSTTNSSQFIASGNGFTVEAWVFYTAISNYTFIVASTTGNNNYNPYWFIGSTNTGTWRLSWGDATSVDTGVSIVLNAWNHVAMVMSSSGSGVFYVNGVSKATASGKTLNGSSTGVLIADGGGTIAGTYPLSGYVSNIR